MVNAGREHAAAAGMRDAEIMLHHHAGAADLVADAVAEIGRKQAMQRVLDQITLGLAARRELRRKRRERFYGTDGRDGHDGCDRRLSLPSDWENGEDAAEHQESEMVFGFHEMEWREVVRRNGPLISRPVRAALDRYTPRPSGTPLREGISVKAVPPQQNTRFS